MSLKSTAFARRLTGYAAAGLAGKVLGYARDAVIMAAFGAGRLTDAYYAAFRVINLLRRSLGEGSLNAAFVPELERQEALGPGRALKFFNSAFTFLMLSSAAACALGMAFSPDLVRLVSYGFTRDPGQFRLTVLLTVILMPHAVFVMASALLTAALNVSRRFFLPALAPSIFSVCVILYALLLGRGPLAGLTPEAQAAGLAAAASLSGLLQAALLWRLAARAGWAPSFSLSFGPGSGRALAAAGPAAATAAQDQLALVVVTFFASFLETGAVTAVYNSARLAQFPVSLVAASCAAVSLPDLSGAHARGEAGAFRDTLAASLKTTLLAVLPAAAGLMALSLPITRALFEHGRFAYEQSVLTSGVLFWLAAGAAGFSVNKLAASALYAMGSAWAPLRVLLAQLALNAVLCALFSDRGAAGLAMATAISSSAAAVLFLSLLRRRVPGLFSRDLAAISLKASAAAGVMAAVCLPAARLLAAAGPGTVTAVCVPLGALTYLAALRVMGIKENPLRLNAAGK